MAWSRTLALLVSDITDRCDVDGYTARHPTATVRRHVIESYQRLRDMMTSAGSRRFVVGPIQLAGTGGVAQLGYATQIPLSNVAGTQTYERISLVEVQIDNRWKELRPISAGELRDYYQTLSTFSIPEAWAYQGNAAEATSSGAAFCLLVAPAFDPATLPIRVYGVTDTTISDSDSTVLTLDAPGFEWIIWDVCIKIASRDNDSQGTYAIAMQERAKQEEQILKTVRNELRTSHQRRDVFHGMTRFRLTRRF
jgi:hypothetical protein